MTSGEGTEGHMYPYRKRKWPEAVWGSMKEHLQSIFRTWRYQDLFPLHTLGNGAEVRECRAPSSS